MFVQMHLIQRVYSSQVLSPLMLSRYLDNVPTPHKPVVINNVRVTVSASSLLSSRSFESA